MSDASTPSAPPAIVATPSRCTPRFLPLDGDLRLEYVEAGEPTGVPVVFLHGVTDSWRSFEPMLPHLPPAMRALLVSQRGHGRSSRPATGYRYRDLAEDVRQFLDAAAVPAAVLVGHSMGSLVAQRFAIDHPDRTLGLVLLASAPTLQGNRAVGELWDGGIAEMTDPIDPAFVAAFQEGTVARPVASGLIETAVAESLLVPARVWRETFATMREENHGGELRRITAPTLAIWGDRDALFLRADQDALLAAIPGADLLVHEGAGHAPHWEDPARVAADLAAFVARRARS